MAVREPAGDEARNEDEDLGREPAEPLPSLTRRFADHDEVRAELNNLLAGSLWVPLPREGRPEVRSAMEVMLVLPDGRVLDGIRGRVFCDAPEGVALFVDDLPVAAITVLSEEPIEDPFAIPRDLVRTGAQSGEAKPPRPPPAPPVPIPSSPEVPSSPTPGDFFEAPKDPAYLDAPDFSGKPSNGAPATPEPAAAWERPPDPPPPPADAPPPPLIAGIEPRGSAAPAAGSEDPDTAVTPPLPTKKPAPDELRAAIAATVSVAAPPAVPAMIAREVDPREARPVVKVAPGVPLPPEPDTGKTRRAAEAVEPRRPAPTPVIADRESAEPRRPTPTPVIASAAVTVEPGAEPRRPTPTPVIASAAVTAEPGAEPRRPTPTPVIASAAVTAEPSAEPRRPTPTPVSANAESAEPRRPTPTPVIAAGEVSPEPRRPSPTTVGFDGREAEDAGGGTRPMPAESGPTADVDAAPLRPAVPGEPRRPTPTPVMTPMPRAEAPEPRTPAPTPAPGRFTPAAKPSESDRARSDGRAIDERAERARSDGRGSPQGDRAIDFPALRRPGDFDPVPSAVSASDNGVWADPSEEVIAGLPALKAPDRPAEPAHAESLTIRYADTAALKAAYQGDLGLGRVFVKTAQRPPVDSKVEVTLVLPDAGSLKVGGQVVYLDLEGIGVKLENLDLTTRALLEAVFSGPAPAPQAEPPPAAPAGESPAASAAPAAPAAPPPAVARSARAIELRAEFPTLADFKKEYETNIRRGGVLVASAERPPIRSAVDVVFSLMQGKREVRLRGEAVFHAPTGVGVQLAEIPAPVRRDIEALLAAATLTPETPAEAPRSGDSPTAAREAAPRPAAPPPAATAPASSRPAPPSAALTAPSAGSRFEGDLVEVLREAEVENEARVDRQLGGRSSWLTVLANLQRERATGVLTASRKAETKTFLVHQGRILDAAGQPVREDESLLRVVKKQNLLKPGPYKILEKALGSKAPAADELGAIAGSGVWTAAEADAARRWQVLERCAEVFAWEKGHYKFEPDGDRRWARPTTGVPVGRIILHGVRSYIRASGEDLARVMRPALDWRVKVVPGTGFDPARVGMNDREFKMWAEIDGEKSVRRLITTSPLPSAQSHRILFALCRLGVLVLEKQPAKEAAKQDRAAVLKERLSDLGSKDPFARLGLSWMAAGPQVAAAWEAMKKELEPDLKAGGAAAEAAKTLFAMGEEAARLLAVEKNRRMQRLRLIEDPSRIEAAAEMLAEKADILQLRGDLPGARSAAQIALDLSPDGPVYKALVTRLQQATP